uniref:Reverse transcriptase domain-containing protein n=1 Tax=Musa acuminata subsp. malaccensis TaxID=214687 RepID=A0A804ICM7_MUSAM
MRTTPKTASGESPFSLAFETEAVLPPEMVFPTLRTTVYEQDNSKDCLRANIDLLEERRAEAHLRTLAYKKATARMYNYKVHPRPIKVRDLVLRKTEVSDPTRPERGENSRQTRKVPIGSTMWSEKAPTTSRL